MSVQTSVMGETVTVIHRRMAYHFRRAGYRHVTPTCADVLDSDESVPIDSVPVEVRRELKDKGLTVVR